MEHLQYDYIRSNNDIIKIGAVTSNLKTSDAFNFPSLLNICTHFAANFHLPPDMPKVLPQLNPNQPHLHVIIY